jgi:hypothetical protein
MLAIPTIRSQTNFLFFPSSWSCCFSLLSSKSNLFVRKPLLWSLYLPSCLDAGQLLCCFSWLTFQSVDYAYSLHGLQDVSDLSCIMKIFRYFFAHIRYFSRIAAHFSRIAAQYHSGPTQFFPLVVLIYCTLAKLYYTSRIVGYFVHSCIISCITL